MKRYLTSLMIFLGGCAFLSASTTFDPVAHMLITHAALDVSRIEAKCGTPIAETHVNLAINSVGQALRYSMTRPTEIYLTDSLSIVNNQLSNLHDTLQGSSVSYCQIKASILADEMSKIEQASGDRK